MAVLPGVDRVALWAEFMQNQSDSRTEIPLTKPELRAFFDAADTWIDNNMVSFNAALPTAARTKMTAKAKALGFMLILRRRFEVS